jgi:fumarate hydratase subunit beta
MSTPPVQLKTPLGDEVLRLRAGDRVELSGIVYTARDEAHLRMQKDGIPFNPEGAVIYHCGPVIGEGKVIAAGPTTSARMNGMEGFLIDKGVRGLIGKGGMGEMVRNQLAGKGVYFAFTGGCAALASSHMTLKGVFFEDLGMAEAVWVIELDRLPLVVGIDSEGNDIFDAARTQADTAFAKYRCSPYDPKKRCFVKDAPMYNDRTADS